MIGSAANDNYTIDTEVVVPLKYLSNFRRSLDLSFVNCEIELDFFWLNDCKMVVKNEATWDRLDPRTKFKKVKSKKFEFCFFQFCPRIASFFHYSEP